MFLGVFESIVLVPTRRISKIAARRQISARGGHNHASTRYSWLARGQFDPSGSNGDGSEAWLHHWLLPVAEQTRKLGKLRDFLEIFLSPGSLLPQRVPEPEFSNFLGPFGPRWTCWTRNFARFLQPPRSCRMCKISLSIKDPESPPKKEPLAMVTALVMLPRSDIRVQRVQMTP